MEARRETDQVDAGRVVRLLLQALAGLAVAEGADRLVF